MAPICQTFVQNTWRKDLCSNCFKSQQEHDYARASSLERTSHATNYQDIGSLPRRYVGVAGRKMYNRNYYGNSQWPSAIENKTSNLLKSPSLIKDMDDLIKQENERNKQLKCEASDSDPIVSSSRHSYPFRDSWLYSNEERAALASKTDDNQAKDCSSDLGSDGCSHDTSASSSLESVGSDSASSGRCSTEPKEVDLDSSYERPSPLLDTRSVPGILKLATSPTKSSGRSITFNQDEDVIGYGGDVDYSDCEDEEYDESEDDDLSVSSLDLNPQERLMKRLTEKNTDFNSENENLSGDVVLDHDDVGSPIDDAPDMDSKNEAKKKLRRSQPHVSVKPLLKSAVASLQEESQLDSYFDSLTSNEEDQPMKGIKPKYVAQEQEMREKCEDYQGAVKSTKVTSIDDIIAQKVTSIDDIIPPKVTSIDDIIAPKVTSIDDIIAPKVTSIDDVVLNKVKTESKLADTSSVTVEKSVTKAVGKSKSVVRPLQMTTIQRRNSFLESQLGIVNAVPVKALKKVLISTQPQTLQTSDLNVTGPPEAQEHINCEERDNIRNQKLELNKDQKEHISKIVSTKPTANALSIPALEETRAEDSSSTNNTEKTKASSRASLTTFGTPATVAPQKSFLHSGLISKSESEMLDDLSQIPQTPPQTAGIKKCAIYASTSCLKGIPVSKPQVTPKPVYLKDRPKLPPKTLIKPRIVAIPNPTRRPQLETVTPQAKINPSSQSTNASDVVYAVPVITTPMCTTSPTSSSSGYSTSSIVSMISDRDSNVTACTTSNISPHTVTPTGSKHLSSFEINRLALQSALNLAKRQAPSPPLEEFAGNLIPDRLLEQNFPIADEPTQLLSDSTQCPTTQSYFQLAPHLQDNQDFDSYSSFTDDFDDDDDVPQPKPIKQTATVKTRSERSSSANPMFRNSIASVDRPDSGAYGVPVSFDPTATAKTIAVRSHSVPRSVESRVNLSSNPKKKHESRFGFVKASFFRPSSPPSMKRNVSLERGRDTTKKPSSGFSLRKFLRIGSSSDKQTKTAKSLKEQTKQANRESRKQQLQIIHPLDYNAAGVEVIARPEKTSPIYDYTGVSSPSIHLTQPAKKPELEEKADYSPQVIQEVKSIHMDSVSVSSGSEQSIKILLDVDSQKVEKKSSFLRKKRKPQRNDSGRLPPTGLAERNSQPKLGYNSEGRPKPPPPPRKTSLECSSDSSLGGSDFQGAHRPPPPRRTSNASRLASLKPSLYANLGDVRAPFTPRKPHRSSSIKEDEKEKRKAPQPPLQAIRHSSFELLSIGKGPAPIVPSAKTYHDYEQIPNGSQPISQNGGKFDSSSASSSSFEKMSSQSNNRTSSLPNLSLEAQYGAVCLSNLEALATLLDQITHRSEAETYPVALKRISAWQDFSLALNDPVCCGVRVFYDGNVGTHRLTAMVTPENKVAVDSLMAPWPAVALKNEVPSSILATRKDFSEVCLVNATIWILPAMSLSSLEEFSHLSQRLLERNPLEWERRVCILLLQFVTALKQLQAKGTEEISLDQILISHLQDGSEASPRLLLVPGDNTGLSLCQSASAMALVLLGHSSPTEGALHGSVLSPPYTPRPHAFSALVTVLREERASSLTKAKCILEAMLYGPHNFKPSTEPNLNQALQSWLDLERAAVLQASLGQYTSPINQIPLMFKFQLIFLVRTSLKSLKEAVTLIEAPDITNF